MDRLRTVVAVLVGGFLVLCLVVGGVALSTKVVSDKSSSPSVAELEGYQAVGDVLVVTASRGGCDEIGRTSVVQSADAVEVTVRVVHTDQTCISVQDSEQVRVALDEPLGDRAVYDGGCLAAEKVRRREVPVEQELRVGLRGLEPLTSSLSGKRSNRLSYRPGLGRRRAPRPGNATAALAARSKRSAAQLSSVRVSSTPPSSVAARL